MSASVVLNRMAVSSPLGRLYVVTSKEGICAVDYDDHEARMMALLQKRFGTFDLRDAKTPTRISDAFVGYFSGDVDALNNLDISMGGTPFQEAVWKELMRIPPGESVCYSELARRLGRPKAARAVGAANQCNPLSIIVPCHRVVGKDGKLTGYAGGLQRKEWLLRHESGIEAPTLFAS